MEVNSPTPCLTLCVGLELLLSVTCRTPESDEGDRKSDVGGGLCRLSGEDARDVEAVRGKESKVMVVKEPRWTEGSTMPMSLKDEATV